MCEIPDEKGDGLHREGLVGAIPIYVEELLLLLTCYVEGTS